MLVEEEEIQENIKEINEEPMKKESKNIIEIETNKGIILKREVKDTDTEKNEANDPKVIINGINILSDVKKEEEKPKSKSGIIFKKLINTGDEELKIKPRKLKTKLNFARTKLDIVNENIIDNDETKEKEKNKEEMKIESENNEKLNQNNEKNEESIKEKPEEELLITDKENIEIKTENTNNLQDNQTNNEQIKEENNIKAEDIQNKDEQKI